MTAPILLVHEEVVAARLISAVLQRAGFDVTHAADGYEALALLAERRDPSLLIIDINLSRPNSTEFLLNLGDERRRKNLSILGLATQGELQLRERVKRLGVDVIIDEPFEPEALVDEVRRWARAPS